MTDNEKRSIELFVKAFEFGESVPSKSMIEEYPHLSVGYFKQMVRTWQTVHALLKDGKVDEVLAELEYWETHIS